MSVNPFFCTSNGRKKCTQQEQRDKEGRKRDGSIYKPFLLSLTMVAILMLVKNDIFMIEFGSRFQLTQLIKHLGFL